MNFEHQSDSRHPLLSLLMLLLWALLGTMIFSIISIVLIMALADNWNIFEFQHLLYSDINLLKIAQFFSATGTFIFPAIMLAKQESNNPYDYLKLNSPFKIKLLIATVFIFFGFLPFIEWTIQWNQQMSFPASMREIEIWMKAKEDEMALITKQFLKMESVSDLLINLFIVAILAGVSEELFFRGCLQKIFIKWTSSYHLGIWIAAIIFSIIHVQFYGFIPRMLLGALFGYLYHFSRNLIIPMIAHCINNGIAVIGAYQLQLKGESLDKLDNQAIFPAYAALLSFIFGIFLLVLYKRIADRQLVLDEH